jgi:hypothetical protein
MVEPIVFFNTYTLKYFSIKLDKMNSHYLKYYSDGEVPSDRNQKIIDSDWVKKIFLEKQSIKGKADEKTIEKGSDSTEKWQLCSC